MKNTTHKGFSTASTLVTIVVVIILAGGLFLIFRPKSAEMPVENPSTNTATSTPSTSTTTSSTPPPSQDVNLKTYANPTLGLSFNYPKDFFLKTEVFSPTTGQWQASFKADRGEIVVHVGKGVNTSADQKLETTSTTISGKTAEKYNTRRDSCDATVARTNLDAEYGISFTFIGCGSQLGSLYKDTADIQATLASVQFLNANTQLHVQPKLGFAFRYPTTWPKPTQATASGSTKITFGNELEVRSGATYSSSLKRNLSYSEVTTGAMTASSTTSQKITVSGKESLLLTTTPTTGPKIRTVYIPNKSTTDTIIITQKGVDSEGLDLVVSSFTFVK